MRLRRRSGIMKSTALSRRSGEQGKAWRVSAEKLTALHSSKIHKVAESRDCECMKIRERKEDQRD
jgi:hypothetical protein